MTESFLEASARTARTKALKEALRQRPLTEEEVSFLLSLDDKTLPTYWVEKYEREAGRNWNKFYQRNENRFFKDRHYLLDEFDELRDAVMPVLLEIGCGVGNAVFPLLETHPTVRVFACDFSAKAIEIVKSHALYPGGRIEASVCDATVGLPVAPASGLKTRGSSAATGLCPA
eukprot:gnl/Hemi2/26652_TR8945_c0_g1_i1.p1 gnl/Hemi2/26652_TR8945_c0_g1~~gnl/Hemi2/26652_TR8945_c0_g1_i1.p1  ORF type:complete len:173 (+),score=36.15 gnl/Hemi2/26652_TR8945_c0_g1_i1:51-569(+)